MGMRLRWVASLSALAGLALFAGAVHAVPNLGASVTCGKKQNENYSFIEASTGCAELGGLFPGGSAYAGAIATAGVLRAWGTTHLEGTAAIAFYSGDVTVNSSFLPLGSTGTVLVTTYYQGSAQAPGTVGDAWLFDSALDLLFLQHFGPATPSNVVGYAFQLIPIGGNGTIIALQGYLHVNVTEGALEFGHTVELIGLQAYDSAGRPVDARFIDADGSTDWGAIAAANAATLAPPPPPPPPSGIPEPGTVPLLAIAGVAIIASRRKSRNVGLRT